MKPAVRRRLETLAERHQELEHLLASTEVLGDARRLREVAQEHARLGALAHALAEHDDATKALAAARAMLADAELRDLAADEIATLEARLADLDAQLQLLLLPVDPRDEANLFLEVRAGTGGDEAALFAGDLLRMYLRYAVSFPTR